MAAQQVIAPPQLPVDVYKKGAGGCMTTHPADGADLNPDHIEHGFVSLKVK